MGIEVPPRAKYLRVMWSELHRIQSHLLWMGLFADSFGFESVFMQFWRIRERIMDISEATTGNRVIVSVNVIGGVRRNPDAEQLRWVLNQLDWVEEEFRRLETTMLEDYTVKKRTVGKGVLSKAQAYELGAAGPTLRGSGVAQDVRQTGYAAYGELYFEPVVETDGDCYARSKVRFRETLASIDLIRRAINRLPDGEVRTKLKGKENPVGETVIPGRAAARRASVLPEGQRREDPGPGAHSHPHLRQHPSPAGHAAGDVSLGRAGGDLVHRPVHQLHRALTSPEAQSLRCAPSRARLAYRGYAALGGSATRLDLGPRATSSMAMDQKRPGFGVAACEKNRITPCKAEAASVQDDGQHTAQPGGQEVDPALSL